MRAPAAAHRPVGHPAPARRDRPLPRRAPRAASGRRPAAARPRPVTIVDAGIRKPLEIEVIVPVEDMGALGELVDEPADGPAAAGAGRARSIWPAIHPRLLELVQQHRSTLIFVNTRRLAERLATRLNELAAEGENRAAEAEGPARARPRAGQGPPRLAVARAAPGDRGRAQAGRAHGPRRHQLARAGHRHGRGRPGHPGRVARRGVAGGCSASAGPATRSASPAGARSSPSTATTWSRSAVVVRRMHDGPDRAHAATRATRSTCWPSRSWPCARSTSGRSTSSPRWCAGPRPSPS